MTNLIFFLVFMTVYVGKYMDLHFGVFSFLMGVGFDSRLFFLNLFYELPCMKRLISISIVLFLLSTAVFAQPDRIGVGLTFAQKIRFNGGDTGNPGLNVKSWFKLDKRKTMFIVPSISAYRPHQTTHTANFATSYLFHADVDFQYRFFNERTLAAYAFAGVNYTHLYSSIEMRISIPIPLENDALFGFGPNIGAGLEMRMASSWDFNLSAKYAFPRLRIKDPDSISALELSNNPDATPKLLWSPLTALVIQVQAVYYFKDRGKGWRR